MEEGSVKNVENVCNSTFEPPTRSYEFVSIDTG